MGFQIENSGIKEEADFSEKDIEALFLPLLRKLSRMQKEAGRRILVMLAAPPGAGKSTMAAFLQYLSGQYEDLTPVTAVSIDGFHHYQEFLLSHKTMVDGEETVMAKIKGAPVTYDLEHLKERIRRVTAGEVCGWPEYSRVLHNPVEDAIRIEGDIILLEGNYLLLNYGGWEELKHFADYSIRLIMDETPLRERLISRKTRNGVDRVQAEEFVDRSDMRNVRTCLYDSTDADLTITVLGDGMFLYSEPLSVIE